MVVWRLRDLVVVVEIGSGGVVVEVVGGVWSGGDGVGCGGVMSIGGGERGKKSQRVRWVSLCGLGSIEVVLV
jgi:hypothetical protein